LRCGYGVAGVVARWLECKVGSLMDLCLVEEEVVSGRGAEAVVRATSQSLDATCVGSLESASPNVNVCKYWSNVQRYSRVKGKSCLSKVFIQ
jgi:hypothetical protein